MPKRKAHDEDGDSVNAAAVRQQRATFLASMSRGISPPPSSRTPNSAVEAATLPNSGPILSHDAKLTTKDTQHNNRERFVPSPFKLTKIRDLPASSNIDTVSLHDILGNPLIKEVWVFNYCFDIDWMMHYFDPDVRRTIQVKIIHGSWKAEDRTKIAIDDACRRWPNVEAAPAYLPDPFGTHHSKMFVLFTHDESAEVIIHTANMLAKDWTNMTQAVWRSGPLLSSKADDGEFAAIGTGKRFKYDLLEYLKAYKRPAKDLVEQLRQYNFDSVKGALVGSVPAKIDNTQAQSTTAQRLWGYPQLREVMRQRALSMAHAANAKPHLVAQISSIATLHNGWLEALVGAFEASMASTRNNTTLSIIYPTAPNVAASLDGYAAGGSIHTKAQSAAHLKQIENLRPHLHQWTRGAIESYRAEHDLAAPHIKTYIQFNTKPTKDKLEAGEVDIEWALVTSANLSMQAWGSLPRTEGKEKRKAKMQSKEEGVVHIQSFEIGVLVWPELFTSPNQSLAKPRMVPVFGKDTPDCGHANASEDIVVGIRMPYDLPLTPYGPALVNSHTGICAMVGLTTQEGLTLPKSRLHGDFIVECKGYQFNVHKAILAVKSPFFASCTDGDFLEAKEGILRFPSGEPVVIATAIRFMHTGDLDVCDLKSVWRWFEGSLGPHTSTYEIRTLVQVYVLADRLMLDPLRNAARQRVSGWDIEYAYSTSYKQHIMKINLDCLVDILQAVYELTAEDDPIRTNITIRGIRAYFRLYSDCKSKDAARVLKIIEEARTCGNRCSAGAVVA